MRNLSNTLANGTLIGQRSDIDSHSVRGLVNSTQYYVTIVVYDDNTDEPIAAFKTISVTTGVGPALTSLTVSPGTPVAVGSGLDADIWSAATPTFANSVKETYQAFGTTLNFSEEVIAPLANRLREELNLFEDNRGC